MSKEFTPLRNISTAALIALGLGTFISSGESQRDIGVILCVASLIPSLLYINKKDSPPKEPVHQRPGGYWTQTYLNDRNEVCQITLPIGERPPYASVNLEPEKNEGFEQDF